MGKSDPQISVLMSTYNENPKHVGESIESILNQSFSNFELIIINDNPNDKSLDSLIKSYSDPRIKYYRNENNIGLAESMNRAASIAKANILARMDADDIAEPFRFQKQIITLEKGDSDLVCGRYSTIDERGNILNNSLGYDFDPDDNIASAVQIRPSIIHHPTVMFRRDLFEKAGRYRNFPCAQDLDLWMRMAESGGRIIYLKDILLKYRINSNSTTSRKHFQQQLTIHYSYLLSIERMRKGYDSFSQESYLRYLKTHGWGNPEKEKRYEHLFSLLSAKGNNRISRLLRRIKVFLSYPSLRNYYLAQLQKKALLNR